MKKILAISLFLCMTIGLSAQDLHFSQFSSAPLTLNPALTGSVPCTYRASANYRAQYGGFSSPIPFATYAVSFDGVLYKPRTDGGGLGLGAVLFNDRGGDAGYSNVSAMFSVAYHQKMGSNKHFLSLGFQGGMVQKSLDYTALRFEDMIQSLGFTLPSSDVISDPSFTYLDVNGGINWVSHFSESFGFQAGAAIFHINRPTESWLGQSNNINSRMVTHAGLRIGIKNKIILLPGAIAQQQGSFNESYYGSLLGFRLTKASASSSTFLYLGGYYRSDESFSSVVALDWNQFQFGLSYDVPIGIVDDITSSGGAFELSFSFNGCVYTVREILDCPRF